jgi:large subunit ribosomal protein L20
MRVSSSPVRRRRHKKVIKAVKGHFGAPRKLYRSARVALDRALSFSYRDRRNRKRDFRRLWITRINAACRQRGITYSRFIHGLAKAGAEVDRKIMAELAVRDELAFDELVQLARTSLGE